MAKNLVTKPDLTKGKALTVVIGMSCMNWRGFVFMWTHIFEFVWKTMKAEGCIHTHAGISSPLSILLISYWESEDHLTRYVRSNMHTKWMKFIYRFPTSMSLFNETYAAPMRANYINRAGGYSVTVDGKNAEAGRETA